MFPKKIIDNSLASDVFIEINFSEDNYHILDKKGQIIESFVNDNFTFDQVQLPSDQILILSQSNQVEAITIDTGKFKIKFREILPFEDIFRIFLQHFDRFLDIIDITYISRISFKTEIVCKFENQQHKQRVCSGLSPIDNLSLQSFKGIMDIKEQAINEEESLEGLKEDTKAQLVLELVRSVKEQAGKQESAGLLFDLDIFSLGKFDKTQALKKINNYRSFLEKDFLQTIENII